MPIRRSRWTTFLIASAAMGGCARYEAKPLTTTDTEKSLAVPTHDELEVAAAALRHPTLKPVNLDFDHGLSPDEIGVLAVIVNPDLRAERDRRDAAGAQLIQAGLLPNPQLTAGVDVPYNSRAPDNHTAYSLGAAWDVTSLITRDAKRRAAAAGVRSVALDVAWKEWQIAEAAKLAAYDLLAIDAQLITARQAQRHLDENFAVMRSAVERHDRTMVDLPAAETAARDARTVVLTLETGRRKQRLILNRAVGLPADYHLKLRPEELPERLLPPSAQELTASIESRLDLLALKRGYESQDATLRAVILGQFPKINLGLNTASDTSNVKTVGLGIGIDLPLFDRGQGVIAAEKATRARLFDEYTSRLFGARADIAADLEDIRSTTELVADAQAAIPALEALARTYDAAMARGNVDVISYYNVRGSLDQKRIEIVKLRQQLVQNWVTLELSAGRYLPMTGPTATTRETKQ